MSIQQVTKEYVIDLQKSEEDRWSEVIRKEGKTAKALIRSASRDFLGYDVTRESSDGWTAKAIRMFSTVYHFSGGHCSTAWPRFWSRPAPTSSGR